MTRLRSLRGVPRSGLGLPRGGSAPLVAPFARAALDPCAARGRVPAPECSRAHLNSAPWSVVLGWQTASTGGARARAPPSQAAAWASSRRAWASGRRPAAASLASPCAGTATARGCPGSRRRTALRCSGGWGTLGANVQAELGRNSRDNSGGPPNPARTGGQHR